MVHRCRITVKGMVQGVGYRPFIYSLASKFGIKGYVLNSGAGLEIDAEGSPPRLKRFIANLKDKRPPLARVEDITIKKLRPAGYESFNVKVSLAGGEKSVLVSPDFTICDDCLNELMSKKDRRAYYPFITCTNCGPRFSIIRDTPYDREMTTMSRFRMCKKCKAEYDDPSDRRFHAETNACGTCGPKYRLYEVRKGQKRAVKGDPVKATVGLLKKGHIVAVKGIGGFHLFCDAGNNSSVKDLRIKKDRNAKPFALISADLKAVKSFCRASKAESELISSKERPIVLLEKKTRSGISELVAPGNRELGVMLAYAPVHYLLLKGNFKALVDTSGNRAENPITKDIDEAIDELAGITSYFLDHNREIYMRVDDSVARVIDNKPYMIRRARGFTPAPVYFDLIKPDILAVGSEMKNTFCVTKKGKAFISQHIGDLKTPNNLEVFSSAIRHYTDIFRVKPRVIAHDMHPEYLSTQFAKGLTGGHLAVQHHHAHIASVMAENGLTGKVIGIAYDGTGYGDDGNVWGGEILIADLRGYKRAAHLKYVALPGGDKANEEPYRMAVSWLNDTFGPDFRGKVKLNMPAGKVGLINEMIFKRINSPMTSSMGRLFDAVSSILGICQDNSFEGQAAIMLEQAVEAKEKGSYSFDLVNGSIIDPGKVIKGIVQDMNAGKSIGRISAKFHNTVVSLTVGICRDIRKRSGLNIVCLGGGCFQNKYLIENMMKALRRNGFKAYIHRYVPCNDGGISLGQAAVASACAERGRSLC